MTPIDILNAYADHAERLSPDNLDELRDLLSPDIHFTDPFNETRGVDAYIRVLAKMFEDVQDPRFYMTDRAITDQAGYLRWNFTFCFRGTDWDIPGMSEVHIDPDGKITRHIDYWDSGQHFYAKLPLIGRAIRWVAKRVGA